MKKILIKKFIAFLKKLFSISAPKTNLNVNQHHKLKRSRRMCRGVLLPGAPNFVPLFTNNLILSNAPKSKYHLETTGSDKKQSWYNLLKTQEMSYEMHYKIIQY